MIIVSIFSLTKELFSDMELGVLSVSPFSNSAFPERNSFNHPKKGGDHVLNLQPFSNPLLEGPRFSTLLEGGTNYEREKEGRNPRNL